MACVSLKSDRSRAAAGAPVQALTGVAPPARSSVPLCTSMAPPRLLKETRTKSAVRAPAERRSVPVLLKEERSEERRVGKEWRCGSQAPRLLTVEACEALRLPVPAQPTDPWLDSVA